MTIVSKPSPIWRNSYQLKSNAIMTHKPKLAWMTDMHETNLISKCCGKKVVITMRKVTRGIPSFLDYFCGGVDGCGKWCEVVDNEPESEIKGERNRLIIQAKEEERERTRKIIEKVSEEGECSDHRRPRDITANEYNCSDIHVGRDEFKADLLAALYDTE